jgi:hypothetical protein
MKTRHISISGDDATRGSYLQENKACYMESGQNDEASTASKLFKTGHLKIASFSEEATK